MGTRPAAVADLPSPEDARRGRVSCPVTNCTVVTGDRLAIPAMAVLPCRADPSAMAVSRTASAVRVPARRLGEHGQQRPWQPERQLPRSLVRRGQVGVEVLLQQPLLLLSGQPSVQRPDSWYWYSLTGTRFSSIITAKPPSCPSSPYASTVASSTSASSSFSLRSGVRPRRAAALVPSSQADKADGPSGTAAARTSSRATHRGFSLILGGRASGACLDPLRYGHVPQEARWRQAPQR
jgi:hypothetical protein